MKDPKHYLHPVFQNPISATDLHKIYADIERAQNDAFNEAIELASNMAEAMRLDYAPSLKKSILKLKKDVSSTD